MFNAVRIIIIIWFSALLLIHHRVFTWNSGEGR